MNEDALKKELGELIRAKRKEHFAQEAFAYEINLDRSYYGQIERGEVNITVMTLHKIAKGLKIQPHQLLKEAGL